MRHIINGMKHTVPRVIISTSGMKRNIERIIVFRMIRRNTQFHIIYMYDKISSTSNEPLGLEKFMPFTKLFFFNLRYYAKSRDSRK